MSDKSETFSPFDAADDLSTFDDVAAYLEAVIDEGDDDPADRTPPFERAAGRAESCSGSRP